MRSVEARDCSRQNGRAVLEFFMQDKNYDWEHKKYLAPRPVLIAAAIVIAIGTLLVAFKLITGTYIPLPWGSRGPLGL
jgi:hypothetical protein